MLGVSRDRGQIAGRLRAARERKGLSQMELAKLSGVDKSIVSRVEAGKINASTKTVFRLATALDVTPAHVFEGIPIKEDDLADFQWKQPFRNNPDGVATRCGVCGHILSGGDRCSFCFSAGPDEKAETLIEMGPRGHVLFFGQATTTDGELVFSVGNSNLAPALLPRDMLLVNPSLPPRHNDIVIFTDKETGESTAHRLQDQIREGRTKAVPEEFISFYEPLDPTRPERSPKGEYRGLVLSVRRWRGGF